MVTPRGRSTHRVASTLASRLAGTSAWTRRSGRAASWQHLELSSLHGLASCRGDSVPPAIARGSCSCATADRPRQCGRTADRPPGAGDGGGGFFFFELGFCRRVGDGGGTSLLRLCASRSVQPGSDGYSLRGPSRPGGAPKYICFRSSLIVLCEIRSFRNYSVTKKVSVKYPIFKFFII